MIHHHGANIYRISTHVTVDSIAGVVCKLGTENSGWELPSSQKIYI